MKKSVIFALRWLIFAGSVTYINQSTHNQGNNLDLILLDGGLNAFIKSGA